MWAKHKKQPGFTIVELLIVIVVIGILAAITIVAYNGIQQRARDSQRRSDIASIQKALELYHADNNGYPICGSASPYQPLTAGTAGTVTACLTTALVPKYMAKLPTDPQNSGSFQYLYAVGYKKDTTQSPPYVGNASDNYLIGNKLETVTSPVYTGWTLTDLTYLVGSAN
jgi:type II secretion system protein G